jgi:DNA-binding NarL/FixJ family response regulator
MHESERIDSDVRAVGAHGYVQKSQAGRDLLAAIDSLLAGGTFFAGKRDAKPSKSGDQPVPGLSMGKALYCNGKKAASWR